MSDLHPLITNRDPGAPAVLAYDNPTVLARALTHDLIGLYARYAAHAGTDLDGLFATLRYLVDEPDMPVREMLDLGTRAVAIAHAAKEQNKDA